jgi:uncharacterized protein YqhQ
MAEAKTTYGGQAVIEGVMMRGLRHFAVACRKTDGEIALTCELVPKIFRPAWQKVPFVRGGFALVDSMTLGTKALFWAAKQVETGASDKASDLAIGGAMVTGLLFAIGLFKVAPHFAIEALKRAGFPVDWRMGLVDFAVRLTIFTCYILLISRMQHVYRVFQYHGAEHKAINALEAGQELTVANVNQASRLHPRCGTSFLVIVLFLSVLAAAFFYHLPLLQRIGIQLAFVFPVAGVSYELLRLAGKYRNNPIADALSRPGMWTQYLTTREPDYTQVEVAIASLKAVMDAEEP